MVTLFASPVQAQEQGQLTDCPIPNPVPEDGDILTLAHAVIDAVDGICDGALVLLEPVIEFVDEAIQILADVVRLAEDIVNAQVIATINFALGLIGDALDFLGDRCADLLGSICNVLGVTTPQLGAVNLPNEAIANIQLTS